MTGDICRERDRRKGCGREARCALEAEWKEQDMDRSRMMVLRQTDREPLERGSFCAWFCGISLTNREESTKMVNIAEPWQQGGQSCTWMLLKKVWQEDRIRG